MNEVTAPQERPAHPIVQFKRDVEAMVMRELDMLDEKAKSRMKNAAVVAVTKDPELLLADRQSFMMAIRMCASHGVIPDGNEAVLQVYNTKVKDQWVKKVTYLPMVRGIINRVLRSGKLKLFYAEVVCEGESFRLDLTHGDRRPVHEYDPMSRSDNVIGAYSVATYDDGTVDTEPMPRAELDKVRAVAKTKNVWDSWFTEKAKVAVMKRHSKRLPLSAEDMDFILNRDETDFDQPKDVTPADAGPRQNLAQRLAAPIEPEVEAEVATGAEDAVEPHWTASVNMDGAFPGTAAWDAGVIAQQEGKAETDCPYDNDAQLAADWLGGFRGAQEAAK